MKCSWNASSRANWLLFQFYFELAFDITCENHQRTRTIGLCIHWEALNQFKPKFANVTHTFLCLTGDAGKKNLVLVMLLSLYSKRQACLRVTVVRTDCTLLQIYAVLCMALSLQFSFLASATAKTIILVFRTTCDVSFILKYWS